MDGSYFNIWDEIIFNIKKNQISYVPKMTCKPLVFKRMMLNICICSCDKIAFSKESPTSYIQSFGWTKPIYDPTHGNPVNWAKVNINKKRCLAKFQCFTTSTSDVLQANTIPQIVACHVCYLLWNNMHHSCWYGFLA